MTQDELYAILTSTGIPCRYLQFNKPQEPPFMIYVEESRNNVLADDSIYHKFKNYRIELYTKEKDPVTEELIETALDGNNIIYTMADVGFIESEALYEIKYYIQI